MKKTLLALAGLLLVLFLFGCGQISQTGETPGIQDSQQVAPESVPADKSESRPSEAEPGREETTLLGFFVEGEWEALSAALHIGQGYSIYIPDGGWQFKPDTDDSDDPDDPDFEDAWESTVNDDVELEVAWYAGKTAETVRKLILADEDDYWLIGDKRGGLGGEHKEDRAYLEISIYETAEGAFAVFCRYPTEAAEGFGARLRVIADTFSVTKTS